MLRAEALLEMVSGTFERRFCSPVFWVSMEHLGRLELKAVSSKEGRWLKPEERVMPSTIQKRLIVKRFPADIKNQDVMQKEKN